MAAKKKISASPKKTGAKKKAPAKSRAKKYPVKCPPKDLIEPIKQKTGRKSIFTKKLGDDICKLIASGMSLRKIETLEGMPTAWCIVQWSQTTDHPFAKQYREAMNARTELLAEEALRIADDAENDTYVDPKTGARRITPEVLGRSKLRVDTRLWFIARLLPKYRDKGEDQSSITVNFNNTIPDESDS